MIPPGGNPMLVGCTRYCSGLRTPSLEGRITWRKPVAKHFDSKGWDLAVKSWMDTDRQAAVLPATAFPKNFRWSVGWRFKPASGMRGQSGTGPIRCSASIATASSMRI